MNLKSKFHYKVWILGLIIIVTSYVIAKLADYYRLEKQEKKYCYFVSNHGEECVYAINLNDYEYKLIFEKDEEKKNSYVRQLDSIALIYCNWCEEQCSEANSNLGFKEPIVDNARFYKIPLGYCVYLAHPLIPLDNRLIRVDLDTSVFSDGHGYVYYEFLHANPLVSTKPCPITR